MQHLSRFEKRGRSSTLVVLLHAYTMSPDKLLAVKRVIEEQDSYLDADIYVPNLNAGLLSTEDPAEIVLRLAKEVDEYWDKRKSPGGVDSYGRIVLVGHSLGALLARKLYVFACGENPDVPFEPPLKGAQPREWAKVIQRVILLAGMNRGWQISHHLSLVNSIIWTAGVLVGNVIALFWRPLLISHIRRGAPFLTQLRLQWLSMRKHASEKGAGDALTVQLLGSIDDMVSPEDNIDLVAGKDFVYLDVPSSGHADVIAMDDTQAGIQRREVFVPALTEDESALSQRAVLPADAAPASERADVTDVVFVVHGIRDKGYWTHKVARRVKALGRNHGRIFETETSSYGYFPMLPFLLPWRRRAKVEWLMDQYAEAKATYPNAEFSFVGHSNGTYLLAKALQEYPSCRFKRVVFAGSVVRRKYDWSALIRSGQVEAILNYVATADWVVAFFPKALQILRPVDLGSAGHDGFDQTDGERIRELHFVRGGHAAALTEENWDAIARFIVLGEPVREPKRIFDQKPSGIIRYPATFAPLILLAILSVAAYLGYAISTSTLPEWQRTVALIGYLWLIWKVVTKL